MGRLLRVLMIEDNEDDAQLLLRELQRGGYDVEFERVETANAMQLALTQKTWDLILSDYTMPQFDAPHALEVLKASGLDLPFIIISGTIGEDTAVTALKAGANDFFVKGKFARLGPAIKRELRETESRRERRQAEAALTASEKRFRSLIEHAPDGIALLGLNGKLLQVTPSTQQILGYTLEEAESQDPALLTHPDDLPALLGLLSDLIQNPGKVVCTEYRFLHKDGSWRWLESTISNLIAEPSVEAIVFNYRDITDQKRAEEALHRSEEQYRSLFEDSPVSLWLEDLSEVKQRLDDLKKNGVHDIPAYLRDHPDFVIECARHVKILDVNSAAMKVYHARQKDELLGSLADQMRSFSSEEFEEELVQIANGRLNFEREQIDETRTGEKIHVSVRWSVAPGYEDSLAKVIVSTIDITQRKQAEDALQKSETRYRLATRATNDVIWEWNANTNQLIWTENAQHVFGYSPEEIGPDETWWNDHIHPEDRQRMISKLDAVMASSETIWTSEYRFLLKDGSYAYISDHGYIERDASGNAVRMIGAMSNITERKQAEETLREKERLLSEAQRIGRIGSWGYDIVKDSMQYSDEMYRLFDVAPEEFKHNSEGFLSLIYSPDRPMVAKWLEDIRVRERANEIEFLIFRKNGELRYIRCRGAINFDKTGKPDSFIGTAQDVTERKLAEIQIRQQLDRLTALRKIDRAISTSFDLNITLDVLISQAISQLQVDAADILLLEADGQTLTYTAGKGFRTQAIETARLHMADSQAGRAARERELVHIESLKHKPDDRLFTPLGAGEGFVCYFGLPLLVKGKVKGVLEVFHRAPLQPYPEWLDFLNTLAGQTAIAIENATLFQNLGRSNQELSHAYDATIEGWSHALDLRDKETEGHTQRVTEMTINLARAFGFPEEELLHIRWGALLHDIGKLGVPDNILLKPGQLTQEEWQIMRQHPEFAYNMLAPITYLRRALDIPYCHHEKLDGTGYPRGLKSEGIPLVARLFAIVDVWDALRSDRPYRAAWTREKTLEHIKSLSGTHFDPKAVEYFLELIKD
jgi:PAS domain S-box-containing protein